MKKWVKTGFEDADDASETKKQQQTRKIKQAKSWNWSSERFEICAYQIIKNTERESVWSSLILIEASKNYKRQNI